MHVKKFKIPPPVVLTTVDDLLSLIVFRYSSSSLKIPVSFLFIVIAIETAGKVHSVFKLSSLILKDRIRRPDELGLNNKC